MKTIHPVIQDLKNLAILAGPPPSAKHPQEEPRVKSVADDAAFDAERLHRLAERAAPQLPKALHGDGPIQSMAKAVATDPWALVTSSEVETILGGPDVIAEARALDEESRAQSHRSGELSELPMHRAVNSAVHSGNVEFLQRPEVANPQLREAMRLAAQRDSIEANRRGWGLIREQLPALGERLIERIADVEDASRAVWESAGASWSPQSDPLIASLRLNTSTAIRNLAKGDKEHMAGGATHSLAALLKRCPAPAAVESDDSGPFSE